MGPLAVPRAVAPLDVSERGLIIAAGFFGATIAVAAFDCSKAVRQSHRSWGRSTKANAYIMMLWVEILTSVALAILAWLFLNGTIPPSIGFFVGVRTFSLSVSPSIG